MSTASINLLGSLSHVLNLKCPDSFEMMKYILFVASSTHSNSYENNYAGEITLVLLSVGINERHEDENILFHGIFFD